MKKIIYFFLFFISLLSYSYVSIAQTNYTYFTQWNKNYYPATGLSIFNKHQGTAVTVNANGKVYVTGYINQGPQLSFGVKIHTQKLDTSGNVLTSASYWQQTDSNRFTICTLTKCPKIISDHNYNVYVLANVLTGSGSIQAILIKYDQNLNQQWVRMFPILSGALTEKEGPVDLDIDNNDNLIATIYDQIDTVNAKIILRKYNVSGNVLWSSIIDTVGVSNNEATQLECTASTVTDSLNQVYITYTRKIIGTTKEIGIRKYSAAGALIWQRTYNADYAFCIAINRFGNLYVGGSINIGAPRFREAILIKYDNNGNYKWFKRFGNDEPVTDYSYEHVKYIGTDTADAVYAISVLAQTMKMDFRKFTGTGVAGWHRYSHALLSDAIILSDGTIYTEGAKNTDDIYPVPNYFTVSTTFYKTNSYNSNGVMNLKLNHSGMRNMEPFYAPARLGLSPDRHDLYMCGRYDDSTNSTHPGWRLVKFRGTTSQRDANPDLDNYINDDARISIIPNPSNGELNINSDQLINKILIFDMQGKMVKNISVAQTFNDEIFLDLKNLDPGFYMFNIQREKDVISKKIVINKF